MKKLLLILTAAILFGSCSNTNTMETKEKVFKKIAVEELNESVVDLIANDWLLVTAGTKENFNMMTISWGTIGNLWNNPVAFVFIRPQRHTFSYMENEKYFTLTAFDEDYRDILNFCGTKSGREYDKVKETGLIPLETELGNMYYQQARLVIECEKIYADDFKGDKFLDQSLSSKIYADGDFHRMYVGRIVNVWVAE